MTHPKKYCCHRACQYEIGKDRCGECVSYDTRPGWCHKSISEAEPVPAKEQDKPPNAWQNIQRYAAEKGAPAKAEGEGSQVQTAL